MKAIKTTLFLSLFFCSFSVAQVIGTTEAGFIDGDAPKLDKPIRLSAYIDGSILLADFNNNAIRTVTKKGKVNTLIGGPEKKGFKDGWFNEALLAGLHGVAYDSKNNLIYTVSASNNVIRAIHNRKGGYYIETVAGNQEEKGFQDGDGKAAKFNSLHQILVGENGEIYVLDIGNAKVRLLKDGIVSTIAGNDSISPLQADFKYPIDMAFDGKDIVICDAGNASIFRLILGEKVVKLELDTPLQMPHGISSNNHGTLYVADMGSNKIVKIEEDKTLTVLEDQNLNKPAAVLYDNNLLWIADLYNHQVKFIELK